ncbi:hypothetical protein [Streptomyces sp. NPDC090025]|uniref:hypothetical protein n=1 Tax=Streptomyces sp. NPDC090025 TaxID=3365922 RepID=UPI003834AD2E
MSAPALPGVLPECQFELHSVCKTGEVYTCYGDHVPGLGRTCACPCHRTPPETAQ